MRQQLRAGYDAPGSVPEDDALDRWPFAIQVVDVVRSTPVDWSVRVGVFGKWGEGKSTVLRFVEQQLNRDGNVVFWFNPWAARTWEDLWVEFSDSLRTALERAGIEIDTGIVSKAKAASRWFLRQKEVIGKAADANSIAKAAYAASFGLLQIWLRPDGEQIRKIRHKLGHKRIVVLVDDLDRADPKLVPQLLLSLREILDLPGFAFVLAFDHDIVGEALREYHVAWVDGGAFLEKILDFRFDLPPVDDRQKVRLMRRELTQNCSFVPAESLDAITDLLPNNPRQLKGLVRNLIALKPEVDRHSPAELFWTDIWLAQLIRLESRGFFQYLLEGDVLEKETGMGYAARQVVAERREQKDELAATLRAHIVSAGVTDETSISRLEALMDAVRARGSYAFEYQAQLGVRPDPLTWKEYRLFVVRYETASDADTITAWIAEHAKHRSVSLEIVVEALFDTMIKERGEALAKASECRTESDHDEYVAVADRVLGTLNVFLIDAGHVTPTRFRRLLDQCAQWAGFVTVPTDGEARGAERRLLIRLLSDIRIEVMEMLDELRPWANLWNVTSSGARGGMLISDCVSAIREKCEDKAIESFGIPGGVQRLLEHGKFMSYKYCLFSSVSGLRTIASQKEKLIRKIEAGIEDQTIHDNCAWYFEFLFRPWNVDLLGAVERAAFAADVNLVVALWRTVTSRRIQFRLHSEYRAAHASLIANGIDPAAIPLPPELAASVSPAE